MKQGDRIVDSEGIPCELSGRPPVDSQNKVNQSPVDTSEDQSFIAQAMSDAPLGMSRFQIERFLILSEPPVGRYFQACTEIKSRERAIRSSNAKLAQMSAEDDNRKNLEDQLANLIRERNILIDIAKEWKPLTKNRSYEEVQEEYWDQHLGRKLAVRLVSGQPIGDLVEPIMLLHQESMTRKFLVEIGQTKKVDHKKVELLLENHVPENFDS